MVNSYYNTQAGATRSCFKKTKRGEIVFRIKEINIEEGESNLMQMGVRMYSARIGRFLSVDPLHEIMPSHNPYHYAFNSPLVWKDPSGLAPEKEKVKNSEKLLMLQLDTRIFEEAYDGIVEENGRAYARMSRTYSYDLNNLRTNGNYFTWNIWNAFNVFDLYMGSGGGSSGSSETARSGVEAAADNGIQDLNGLMDKCPDRYEEMIDRITKYEEELNELAKEGKTKEIQIIVYEKESDYFIVYKEGPIINIDDRMRTNAEDVDWLSISYTKLEIDLMGNGYKLAIESHSHPHIEVSRIIEEIDVDGKTKKYRDTWTHDFAPSSKDMSRHLKMNANWLPYNVIPKSILIFGNQFREYNQSGFIGPVKNFKINGR